MEKIISFYKQINEDRLMLAVTLLGAVLAWRINYIQHGWVNVDSLIYFESARLFSIGEWKQAVTLFNWPLYSLLISTVHQLTKLDIQTSAQILDILFFTITTFSFTKLIQLAGGNKLTILCGAFLLFSSSYIVGNVLPMLLRDQGFWALFLSSLFFFIKFYRTQKIAYALLWQSAAIIAMLFRIEAITFLVCLPIVLLFKCEHSLKEKFKQLTIINIIPIISLLLIIVALITIPSVTLSDFGRLQEVVTIFPRMMTDIAHMFIKKAHIMGEQVLGYYFSDYGLMGVILTLFGILTLKIINIISWPVIGIYSLSRFNQLTRLQMSPDAKKVFYTTAAIALLNAIIIIAQVFVLSNRYIISLGFISLIFAAFCLASLLRALRTQSTNSLWRKVLLIIILLILGFSFIKNLLPKKEGYNFEQEAVTYIKRLNIPNSKVFFVTSKSTFYAGANYEHRRSDHWQHTKNAIEDGSIYKYDYLMLYLDVDKNLMEREKIFANRLHSYSLDKEFYGLNGKKKIMIYAKHPPNE